MHRLKTVLALSMILGVTPALCVEDGLGSSSNVRLGTFNVDGLLGLDLVAGGANANSANFGWGGRVGYLFQRDWEVGFSATTVSSSAFIAKALTATTRLTLLMAEIAYHLPRDMSQFYILGKLGLGIASTTGYDEGNYTGTNFAWGVGGGYDIPLGGQFTFGPRVTYNMVTVSNNSAQSDFQVHGALKFFFN